MKLIWFGHACFQLENNGYTVVFDPYLNGTVPGLHLSKIKADMVLCSHEHSDHNGISEVIMKKGGVSPYKITKVPSYHDDQQGKLRGKNLIHVLDDGTYRIAHMGDLGCMINEEQAALLSNLDVCMIPVGGYYTIDAKQAKEIVRKIKPRVVLPMHYRGDSFGYEVLASLVDYTDLCDDVIKYDSNELEISKEMSNQTAILKVNDICQLCQ